MLYCKTNDEAVVFYYTDDETSWRIQCVEANGAWLGK
jgi:hypothetical protein